MKELVNNVETLFNVFVPGALCVWFYTKLSLKKIEYQGFLSLSIAFGFTIKYIIDYADHLLGRFTIKGFPIVVVYIVTGIVCSALFYKIKNSIPVRKWFSNHLGYDIGDNIWTRHIDFSGQTDVMLHMDDGTYIYGTIENADNDYIVLTYHATATDRNGDKMDEAVSHLNDDTALCVPMSHVKRFEFMYDNLDSETAKYVLR